MIVIAGPADVIRAMEFARLCDVVAIEDWMCWAGWLLHIGCDRCVAMGKDAHCWGRAGCHGFHCACGCRDCAERQARELAELETRAA